jgi:hypothetical protein
MPKSSFADAVTGTGSYSLRHQIILLDSNHIHVNLILVGYETFTESELADIDVAVFAARWIYAKVGLGIGRVSWFAIPLADAMGFESIASDDEAQVLTNSWTVHNDGLDVFILRAAWFDDERSHRGISEQEASCDKDRTDGFSGSVVSLGGALETSFTLPHEMAHDLGLHHIGGLESEDIEKIGDISVIPLSVRKNLMFPDRFDQRNTLTPEQGNIMRKHCLIQPGCWIFP